MAVRSKKLAVFQARLPGLRRLLSYQQQWLRGDLLAGITVAAYLIPQCMAYGELAGVEPIAGLWAILPPMLIYALFGSSPQLSVGPESTTAVMTAVAISPLIKNGSDYASLASTAALFVGLICMIGYVARLGFLADLLSKPILTGYMAGVAGLMITSQLSKVSGITINADTILGELQGFVRQLDQVHWPTAMVAGFVLLFLFTLQTLFPRAPGPLIAVLMATLAVALFDLDQTGVAVVGTIPAGLPRLHLPQLSIVEFPALTAAALGIAVVAYSDNVLTARSFANRNHYKIDANQELLALGISNLGTGLMQGIPVSSSGSRTVISDALGSKTQLYSVVAFLVLISVLLFLRPLLALFPTAALGAIVIFAATKLIEIAEFQRMKRFRRNEFVLALTTTFAVLATDILIGVAIAVGLSVIDLFARVARPHDAVQGKVPGLAGLHDIDDWAGATTIPGLVIYRYDAPLCFANAENFKQRALAAIEAEQVAVEWFVLNTEAIIEVDITAVDMLDELRQELADRGITFGLVRMKQDLYLQLMRSQFLNQIDPDHIFATLPMAISGFEDR
ncbi:MAG: solute carrier family 26 protein [Thermosynechococcaceae cyanobacterium]